MSETNKDKCPNAANHTPAPTGYLEWHEWAEEMSETHKTIRCPGCGLFAIWIKKGESEEGDE